MIPILDIVMFPHMMAPVRGRQSGVCALEETLAAGKVFLATEYDASIDEPKRNEIYQVATIINLAQNRKLLPDGNIKVPVERNADDCPHQP